MVSQGNLVRGGVLRSLAPGTGAICTTYWLTYNIWRVVLLSFDCSLFFIIIMPNNYGL